MDGSSLLLLLLLGHVDRTVLQLCDVKLQPSVQQLAQTLDGIPAEGLGILYGRVYLEAGMSKDMAYLALGGIVSLCGSN